MNLEVDVLAKYVERLLLSGAAPDFLGLDTVAVDSQGPTDPAAAGPDHTMSQENDA